MQKIGTIGLIGGMGWQQTAEYIQIINEKIHERLGGFHTARCVTWFFDTAELEELQRAGKWFEVAEILVDAAQRLEKCGADVILVCSNTLHRVAEEVAVSITVPLLHIVDPTAEVITNEGFSFQKVGLVGTAYTIERNIYVERLQINYGLEVLVPTPEDTLLVHKIIYEGLVKGHISEESNDHYLGIMHRLVDRGAEAIILGCSEVMLSVSEDDCGVPIFNSTKLHAEAAAAYALQMAGLIDDPMEM